MDPAGYGTRLRAFQRGVSTGVSGRAAGARGVMGQTDEMIDHWQMFSEFCRYETAVGGPSPHAKMVGEMIRGLPVQEQVWRIGCYGGVYNTGGALALWTNLDRTDVITMGEEELRAWLEDHWKGLPFRRERRAVRTPVKLAKYLRSYAMVSRDWPDRDWWVGAATVPHYEAGWKDVQKVYGVGRYIAIRMLEMFSWLGSGTVAYDMRSDDAWSPRRTLALLLPSLSRVLNEDTTRAGNAAAETIARTTLDRLAAEFDVNLTIYELQVMLCEYRQSIISKRQYPGRSIDSEVRYLIEAEAYWGESIAEPGWQVRKTLFPDVSLGEVHGWDKPREELGAVAADYGYTWSDLIYDFPASHDLSKPVRRAEVLA